VQTFERERQILIAGISEKPLTDLNKTIEVLRYRLANHIQEHPNCKPECNIRQNILSEIEVVNQAIKFKKI
jgi:hypothetical protein